MNFLRYILYPLLSMLRILYYALYSIDRKITREKSVSPKVISIGNLSTGGTGKTPMVMSILEAFRTRNLKNIAVLMRGYKRKSKGILEVSSTNNISDLGDEASLIKQHYPDVSLIVASNRYKSAVYAQKKGFAWLLLDDGYQSYELARDINILLVDATRPISADRLLPLGNLREPIEAVKRATALVLTRSNMVAEKKLAKERYVLQQYNHDMEIFHSVEEIASFAKADKQISPSGFAAKRLYCFCAIGNPNGFYYLLQKSGAKILKKSQKRDHYLWKDKDIDKILAVADHEGLEVVTTEKDIVKISEKYRKDIWILKMKTHIKEKEKWSNYINAFV